MATRKLYRGSDNVLEVLQLTDVVAASPVTGATVTAEIRDANGALVPSTAISLPEDGGSPADYRGTFPAASTANLVVGDCYSVLIDANGGTGLRRRWTLAAHATESE